MKQGEMPIDEAYHWRHWCKEEGEHFLLPRDTEVCPWCGEVSPARQERIDGIQAEILRSHQRRRRAL